MHKNDDALLYIICRQYGDKHKCGTYCLYSYVEPNLTILFMIRIVRAFTLYFVLRRMCVNTNNYRYNGLNQTLNVDKVM